MYKKILITCFLSVLVAAPAIAADIVTMNLNTSYGATNFQTLGTIDFAGLVEKYSGGDVKINVRPAGNLGFKETELLKVVKDGHVPMSDVLMGMVAENEPVFSISSLPRLVKSYEEARNLYEACKPLYDQAAEKWNQKILYVSPWPPSGLITKKILNTSRDLEFLTTRTYDKNGAAFIKELGGDSVSMPWGEVFSSLRTKKINSVLTSAESAKEGRFWEILSCFTKINYAYALNMVTINLDHWKALSKEQQTSILRAAEETGEAQWQNSRNSDQESFSFIKKKGMTVLEKSPQLKEKLDNAARIIIDAFMVTADENVKVVLKPFIK